MNLHEKKLEELALATEECIEALRNLMRTDTADLSVSDLERGEDALDAFDAAKKAVV